MRFSKSISKWDITDKTEYKGLLTLKEWVYMAFLICAYVAMRTMGYSTALSYVFQMVVVCLTVVLFINTPVMSVSTILVLNVLPNKVYYATHSSYSNHYSLNAVMVMIMVGALFVYKFVIVNKGRIKQGTSFVVLAIMSMIMGCSVAWAEMPSYYSDEFYMLLVIYMAIPLFIETKHDIVVAWMGFCVGGGLFAIDMLKSLEEIGNIYDANAVADRNYLAMYGVICFMMLICFAMCNKIPKKWYFTLTSIVIAGVIAYVVMSFASRTAFIMVVSFCFLLFISMFWKNRKVTILLIITGIIVVWLILNTDVADYLFERLYNDTTATGNGRFEIMRGFSKGFWDADIFRKLVGYGLNGFTVDLHFAHNAYLGILLNFGVISFGLFVFVVLKSMHKLAKSELKMLNVAFFVFLVYAMTLDTHTDTTGACFLAFFAGVADLLASKETVEGLDTQDEDTDSDS